MIPLMYGLQLGIVYGFIAYLFMQAPFFEKVPVKINKLVRSMKLSVFDGLFFSLCAGIGEELLFRQGIQSFTGVLLTSVLFVALHGYLNPYNLRFSVYGLIVLPFIILISYGLDVFGIWFCIAAHFSYDAVLFTYFYAQRRLIKFVEKKICPIYLVKHLSCQSPLFESLFRMQKWPKERNSCISFEHRSTRY